MTTLSDGRKSDSHSFKTVNLMLQDKTVAIEVCCMYIYMKCKQTSQIDTHTHSPTQTYTQIT